MSTTAFTTKSLRARVGFPGNQAQQVRIAIAKRLIPLLAAMTMITDAAATLTVNLPWAKPSAGGTSAEVYLQVTSTDDGEITGINTFAAKSAALLAPGTARKVVTAIPLAAGTPLDLAPGKYRIALTGLVRPLKPREMVPLTLIIKSADGKRQEMLITAEVRQRSAMEDEANPHQHHHH